MKSTFILTALFLCFFQSASCQEADVTFSPEIKIDRNADLKYLGKVNGDYCSINTRTLRLFFFDALTLQLKNKIDLYYSNKFGALDSVHALLIKNEVIIFFSDFSEYNYYNYYYTTFDLHGNLIQEITQIGNDNLFALLETKGHNAGVNSNYFLNDSQNKIAFVAQVLNENKRYNKFLAIVYSYSNGKLLEDWKMEFSLPQLDNEIEIKQLVLSKSKRIYALLNVKRSKKETKENDKEKKYSSNKYYELISVNANGFTSRSFDLNKKSMVSAFIKLDIFDRLILAGMIEYGTPLGKYLYSAKNKYSLREIDSIFIYKINSLTDITMDSTFKYISNLYPSNADRGATTDYIIKDIIFGSKNKYYIVGEQYASESISTPSAPGFGGAGIGTPFGTANTTIYTYKDLAVIKLDYSDNILWVHRVPKTQISSDEDRYNSFSKYYINDSILFVFNQDIKELGITEDNESIDSLRTTKLIPSDTKMKKSVAVLVTVTTEGKVTKKLLFSNKDSDAILVPKRSVQLSETECLLYAEKGKTIRLGILKLK